jgi:hypothetical protein
VIRTVALAIAAVAAGCGPSGDPLEIRYTYAIGSEQACLAEDGDPVEDCTDIPMSCNSAAMLRIVDADDPTIVYFDHCGIIPNTSPRHDLCPISQAFPDTGRLPTDRVAVQIAVYNLDDLELDASFNPICPANVKFTTSGFVAPTTNPQPALAGMAYTDGFDSGVTVELGCNDSALIDTNECRNENTLDVSATVVDFDNQISVSTTEAQDIEVDVGEPVQMGGSWNFDNSASTFELPLVEDSNPPLWSAVNLDIELLDYGCVQVVDLVNPTAVLTCRPLTLPLPRTIDLAGIRVGQDTVDDIIDALGLPGFPTGGLVIGKVVLNGDPVEGATVLDSTGATIRYLSVDRTTLTTTATSSNGIFVANVAPFETTSGAANHWSAMKPETIQINDPVGGQVRSRLMVVIIEMMDSFGT